jgi:hypothetical protein
MSRWLKQADLALERTRDLSPAEGDNPEKLTVSIWLGLKPVVAREKKKRSSVEFAA